MTKGVPLGGMKAMRIHLFCSLHQALPSSGSAITVGTDDRHSVKTRETPLFNEAFHHQALPIMVLRVQLRAESSETHAGH